MSFYLLAKASPPAAATASLSGQESHDDRVALFMMKK